MFIFMLISLVSQRHYLWWEKIGASIKVGWATTIGIRKSPTVRIPYGTIIVQVRHSDFFSDHMMITCVGEWLGVRTDAPLRTSILTGSKWSTDICLRFRSVWLRDLHTCSYFNLTGLELGESFHSNGRLHP